MSAPPTLGEAGQAALQSHSPDQRQPFRHASDAELVAGVTGGSLVESAALIDRFGSLHRLARAAQGELVSAGLPEEESQRLAAGVALGMRIAEGQFALGEPITSPTAVIDRFRPRLMLADRESMMAVLLDTRHHVIGEMEISVGTLNTNNMTPREVFAHALRENAHAMILLHNHPSGSPSPSPTDAEFTRVMAKLGHALKVNLLDSIVVGREGGVSLQHEMPHLFQVAGEYGEQVDQAVKDSAVPIRGLEMEP